MFCLWMISTKSQEFEGCRIHKRHMPRCRLIFHKFNFVALLKSVFDGCMNFLQGKQPMGLQRDVVVRKS